MSGLKLKIIIWNLPGFPVNRMYGYFLLGVCLQLFDALTVEAKEYTKDLRTELFSCEELLQLGSRQTLSPTLAAKLHVLSTTPFSNNEAYYLGAKSRPLSLEVLAPSPHHVLEHRARVGTRDSGVPGQ